jgi:hypothetical protein
MAVTACLREPHTMARSHLDDLGRVDRGSRLRKGHVAGKPVVCCADGDHEQARPPCGDPH